MFKFRIAILLMLITSNLSALESNETLESGDVCNKSQKLPEGFLCHEESIIDCKVNGTRIDYQICRGDELNRLDLELNKKYQQILKKYNAPNTEYANYKKAKVALIRAQKAWVKFRQEDCDMPMYLNITGTAQSPMMMDCAINHTKKRIEDFDSGFYE